MKGISVMRGCTIYSSIALLTYFAFESRVLN